MQGECAPTYTQTRVLSDTCKTCNFHGDAYSLYSLGNSKFGKKSLFYFISFFIFDAILSHICLRLKLFENILSLVSGTGFAGNRRHTVLFIAAELHYVVCLQIEYTLNQTLQATPTP
jgi:hypothetical protein